MRSRTRKVPFTTCGRRQNPLFRLSLVSLESRLAPAVTVSVDATANAHAISPLVYGTAFGTSAQLADLNAPINRDGGNASDTYSYANDATNHGSDWYFESIASGTGNGQGMDSFVSSSLAGGAQPSVTVNLFDYAAKLGAGRSILGSFGVPAYGPQQSTDPYWPNWGNGVHTNGTNVAGNNPNDAYTPNSPAIERAWIQHLISTFGDSQHGGVQYYTMGNEPGLWNSTHRDIHPAGDTLPELRDKIIAYASTIKSLDPGARILGPEEWGWTNYFISGADAAASNWGATYNGLNAEAWLLDQLHQHDLSTGTRLLDYFTLHDYPQGGEFGNDVSQATQLLRNQSTRSLWDPNYVDQSWIASTGIDGGKVNMINRMKAWVNAYYPGTKIGLTEYNWGAEGHMNGATTQADIWGIFGRESLDLANRWTTPATGSPTYLAMKLYRNYDGAGGAFGNTSVSAAVPNPDQVSAFASIRSSDGALTIVVDNKNLVSSGANTSIAVDLSHFANAGVAQEWQLAAVNPSDLTVASITRRSDISFSGNSFTIASPNQSVEMFVLRPAAATPSAPTGLNATPGNGQVSLVWNAVTGATSYNVFRGTSPGGEGAVAYQTTTGTSFIDTAVANGTTYYYQVAAVNGAGPGLRSNEVSATPQVPAPSAPTGLTAAPGNAVVTLSWSATAGAASYTIYRGTASGAETLFQSGITGPTFPNAGLSNGTTYFYQVASVNPGGESPRSIEVSATPQVPVSPPPPPPPPPPPAFVGYHEFGTGNGAAGTVRFFNPDGSERFNRNVFPGFTGGVRVASADFNGDGIADLVAGTGPGVPTRVVVLDGKDGHQIFAISPFEASFTGGVFVSAGDITGDGKADLVISPDEGGGPRVRVFDGNGFAQINDFFGIDDPNFRGGARTAIGDVNNDGKADLLVAAGFGGGPRVAVFDGSRLSMAAPPKLFGDFFVFEPSLRNGAYIAAGDLTGDGYADVIAGGGPGGGPRVFALSGKDLLAGNPVQVANFFAGDPNNRGGIRVAVRNLDGDGQADLVVGDGAGAGSTVTAYLGKTIPANGAPTSAPFAFDAFPGFVGGVFVG